MITVAATGVFGTAGTVNNDDTFTNDGTISIASGGEFNTRIGSALTNNSDILIQSGGVLNIVSGAEADNEANIYVSGTLNNNQSFDNGSLSSSSALLQIHSGGVVNTDFSFINYGDTTIDAGGLLHIDTAGGLYNYSNQSIITNNGTFQNENELTLYSSSDFQNNSSLVNSGTIYSYNNSTLNNNNGATLTNNAYIDNRATLINQGTVENNNQTFGIDNRDQITNENIFNNAGLLSNRDGATLDNSGTLTNDHGISLSLIHI